MHVRFPKEDAVKKILKETESLKKDENVRSGKKLRGDVGENEFDVSLNIKEPGRYLPIVRGKIEQGEEGSKIFLDYRLRLKTRRSLIIWLILTGSLSVFFIVGYNRWLYGVITFSLGMVKYILTRENFSMQVQRTGHVLNKILKP